MRVGGPAATTILIWPVQAESPVADIEAGKAQYYSQNMTLLTTVKVSTQTGTS